MVAILVHIAKCAADTAGHIGVVFVDLGILALGGRGGNPWENPYNTYLKLEIAAHTSLISSP